MAETQISTDISGSTKEQLERYAEAPGVKNGYLVVIPPRLTLTPKSFEMVSKLVKKPRKPTKPLRDLLAGKTL